MVRYLDSGSGPICQKGDLKSSLENILAPLNFCQGIGRLVDCTALLTFLAFSVTLMSPFGFGVMTVLEIHGAGLFSECFSITSSFTMVSMAF